MTFRIERRCQMTGDAICICGKWMAPIRHQFSDFGCRQAIRTIAATHNQNPTASLTFSGFVDPVPKSRFVGSSCWCCAPQRSFVSEKGEVDKSKGAGVGARSTDNTMRWYPPAPWPNSLVRFRYRLGTTTTLFHARARSNYHLSDLPAFRCAFSQPLTPPDQISLGPKAACDSKTGLRK